MNTPKQHCVLWVRGGRVASVPLCEKYKVLNGFHALLIQRDATGTEHWNVVGIKRGAK